MCGKKRIFVLPDAMAWTALNALYRNISGSWTDGDAIVPGSNSRVSDIHGVRVLDVNPIGVRAIPISRNFNAVNLNVIALVDNYMELLAIDRS